MLAACDYIIINYRYIQIIHDDSRDTAHILLYAVNQLSHLTVYLCPLKFLKDKHKVPFV